MLTGRFRKNFFLFSHFPLAKPPRIVYNTIVAQLTAHADVAQQVERILGKDEVTGSNPVISSMKPTCECKSVFVLFGRQIFNTKTRLKTNLEPRFYACFIT